MFNYRVKNILLANKFCISQSDKRISININTKLYLREQSENLLIISSFKIVSIITCEQIKKYASASDQSGFHIIHNRNKISNFINFCFGLDLTIGYAF